MAVILINYFSPLRDRKNYQEVCETKKDALKAVITACRGHGIYPWVVVDNLSKSVNINVRAELSNVGFEDSHVYDVGDSIIKEAMLFSVAIIFFGSKKLKKFEPFFQDHPSDFFKASYIALKDSVSKFLNESSR